MLLKLKSTLTRYLIDIKVCFKTIKPIRKWTNKLTVDNINKKLKNKSKNFPEIDKMTYSVIISNIKIKTLNLFEKYHCFD